MIGWPNGGAMYKRVLITVDHSSADETILAHIEALHQYIHCEVVLLHVADGWGARYFDRLKLKATEEMKEDLQYLSHLAERLRAKGITTTFHLAAGEPAREIVKFANDDECNLIAMATHGHRWLADFFFGSTADKVRHEVDIPVLLLKAPKQK